MIKPFNVFWRSFETDTVCSVRSDLLPDGEYHLFALGDRGTSMCSKILDDVSDIAPSEMPAARQEILDRGTNPDMYGVMTMADSLAIGGLC